MSKESTCDEFESKDFLHFPDGIICEICLRQTFWLNLRRKKGKKLLCDYCCRSSLRRVSLAAAVNFFFLFSPKYMANYTLIQTFFLGYNQRTDVPFKIIKLNHIAVVGRSSRGDSIEIDNFSNLMSFIKKWP
jgi:hypothetical protein